MSHNTEEQFCLDDIHCPTCNGVINSKWFNFRSGNTVEFIAECWTPENPDSPRHIFYFQIKTPPCILFDDEGKSYSENEEES